MSFYDSLANETVTAYKYLNAFETRDNKYIQLSLISKINVIEVHLIFKFAFNIFINISLVVTSNFFNLLINETLYLFRN